MPALKLQYGFHPRNASHPFSPGLFEDDTTRCKGIYLINTRDNSIRNLSVFTLLVRKKMMNPSFLTSVFTIHDFRIYVDIPTTQTNCTQKNALSAGRPRSKMDLNLTRTIQRTKEKNKLTSDIFNLILQMRACTKVTLDNEFTMLCNPTSFEEKNNQQSRKILNDNVVKFNSIIKSASNEAPPWPIHPWNRHGHKRCNKVRKHVGLRSYLGLDWRGKTNRLSIARYTT